MWRPGPAVGVARPPWAGRVAAVAGRPGRVAAVARWPWADPGAAVGAGRRPVRVAVGAERRRAEGAAVRRGRAVVVAGGQPRAEPVAGVQLHAGLVVAAGHLPPAAVVQVVAERPAWHRVRQQARRDLAWHRPRQSPRARP